MNMSIYVYKNGLQSGPFDEESVKQRLAAGELSPDDQGIRQGETDWKPLGQMFPSSQAANPVAAAAQTAQAAMPQAANLTASAPAVKTGGCRRTLGILMLVFGLLGFLGGTALFAATFFMPESLPCKLADMDKKKADDAIAAYEKAKDTPDELSKKFDADRAVSEYGFSVDSCRRDMDTRKMGRLAMIVVAVLGFLGAIIGFFLRR